MAICPQCHYDKPITSPRCPHCNQHIGIIAGFFWQLFYITVTLGSFYLMVRAIMWLGS